MDIVRSLSNEYHPEEIGRRVFIKLAAIKRKVHYLVRVRDTNKLIRRRTLLKVLEQIDTKCREIDEEIIGLRSNYPFLFIAFIDSVISILISEGYINEGDEIITKSYLIQTTNTGTELELISNVVKILGIDLKDFYGILNKWIVDSICSANDQVAYMLLKKASKDYSITQLIHLLKKTQP